MQSRALLENPLLPEKGILLVKRPAGSPALGLPANWQGNSCLPRKGFNDELLHLSPVRPGGELATVYHPGGRFVGDVDLDFSGDRLLFSSVNDQGRWRIYEMDLAGRIPRPIPQIDEPDVDNYDACYLPDGDILFSSTATFVGVPCVFGSTDVANFYRLYRADGAIRRLTFDQEHNWCPTVLPSGRVMYLRWEYADLAHPNSRILFSMNPDAPTRWLCTVRIPISRTRSSMPGRCRAVRRS
jgi:hypothetical protein